MWAVAVHTFGQAYHFGWVPCLLTARHHLPITPPPACRVHKGNAGMALQSGVSKEEHCACLALALGYTTPLGLKAPCIQPHTYRHAGRQGQEDRHTYIQADVQADRQTDRLAHRQTGPDIQRQIDR